MKIYKKIVLNLQNETVEEDSYEYLGPIAKCGSGGGSSSGKSDWPDYMKTKHEAWLGDIDAVIPVTNPYTGIVAYAPTAPIAALATALTNYKAFNSSVGTTLTTFKTMWSGWLTTVSNGLNEAMVAALDTSGIPEFEAGMRDINAVQTSSFALGKAMLYARVGLEASKLALMNTNQAVELTMKFGESLRGQFASEIENARLTIIALKEQADRQVELDVEEARWIFFNYREAGALLGAIGGPSAMAGSQKPNPAASALGGAMSGAAAGAAFGPYGAVIGAVVGGVGGYLSAS